VAVRLARRVSAEILDIAQLRAGLGVPQSARLQTLELLESVDSTNTRLLVQAAPTPGFAKVCIAERQTAGRGRRGRSWMSAPGGALTLSVGWRLERAQGAAGLSLAVGVAVVRALERLDAHGLRLKWPNDIWLADRKVGGVLTELAGEAPRLHAVVGVGLNVTLEEETRRAWAAAGVRAAAVADACRLPPSRNRLAAALIDEILALLVGFEAHGFGACHADWSRLDALRDRPVRLSEGAQPLEGWARGVDEGGALLLDTGARVHRVLAGEVSLRLAEGAT
jgi:BirA family biotin operon repressor/biotin-[acetyl-CoA-carboxylase] ligase